MTSRGMAALLSLLLMHGSMASASACEFGPWFEFKGTKLRRNADRSAYLYFTDHSRVDADGAPNAYHPDDVGKNCINDPHVGLDCPGNAGYPTTDWWDDVLVPDPDQPSRAFVQPSGPHKGFFVSTTWLEDGSRPAIDPRRYVDAASIPYLVFPGNSFQGLDGTGSRGDVGIAWNLRNGRKTSFVVADHGGGSDARLGEASIAFYEALGGANVNPRDGSGVAAGTMRFLVFPGSRNQAHPRWPRTKASIATQADALLAGIGGEAALADCR